MSQQAISIAFIVFPRVAHDERLDLRDPHVDRIPPNPKPLKFLYVPQFELYSPSTLLLNQQPCLELTRAPSMRGGS